MIKPYVKPRPRPTIALLLEETTVLRENGHEGSLDRALAAGVHVWASAELLRELTRAGNGSAVLWRFVPIGWSPHADERKVWPVRALAVPMPESPHETLSGLRRWRDWLCIHGAAPAGSLGGSGLSLVKATLRAPLWTSVGTLPPIHYTLGGRQIDAGVRPARYVGELELWDMQAAYARTLGGALYGGRWERIPYRPFVRAVVERDPTSLVYARAVVDIPELEPWQGPLPVRQRGAPGVLDSVFWNLLEDVYPVGRRLQGTWAMQELLEAESAGCTVRRVLDVWVHSSTERPFVPWLQAVEQGRELGGFAGLLAKATGNATWGQFSIAKGQKVVESAGGRRRPLPLRGGNPSQRAFDLAEWICACVRARLHAGVMHVGDRFVCAHTDGLWSIGTRVPGWRLRETAHELRVVNPQCLAYRDAGGEWSYTVAGVLDPGPYFEELWKGEAAA